MFKSCLQTFEIKTKKKCGIVNITNMVSEKVKKSGIKNGIVTVHVAGSTGGISTIEYEQGLKKDVEGFLEKIIPFNYNYEHHKTWNDFNGSSHLRSFLIGTSQTFPFQDKRIVLGTWQQIIFCEFDERDRNRTIYCQIMGETEKN